MVPLFEPTVLFAIVFTSKPKEVQCFSTPACILSDTALVGHRPEVFTEISPFTCCRVVVLIVMIPTNRIQKPHLQKVAS